MQDCKKRIDTITRHYFTNENKTLLASWLNEIGEAIKPELEENKLQGLVFNVPLENGTVLSLEANGPYLKVSHFNNSLEVEPLVNEEQYRKNTLATLKTFANKIKEERIGLGYPYPFVLRNLIKNLHQDEVITFDNGMSFLCTETNNGFIALRKICGNILTGASLSNLFSMAKPFDVALSDKEMQNLYSKIKSSYSDSIKGRKVSLFDINKEIKYLEDKVDKNSEHRYDFGPLIVKYKKTVMSGNKWLNEDGRVLDKAYLVNILSWMKTAPVITEYKRKEPSLEKEYNDNLFDEKLEQQFKEGRFENIVKEISTYCIKEQGDLEFVIKSYVKEEDDYIATGFQFTCTENGILIRRSYYEDNDLSNHMETLKKVPVRIFMDFCEEKFRSDYFVIKNKKRSILMKGMPELRA